MPRRSSAGWLAEVGEPDEARLANRLADLAGTDPALLRVGDLVDAWASRRGVQRLARRYIGLSPAALIIGDSRLRQAHPERRRTRTWRPAAADLGYADQAHLTNEFTRVLEFTPASYRRTN